MARGTGRRFRRSIVLSEEEGLAAFRRETGKPCQFRFSLRGIPVQDGLLRCARQSQGRDKER